MSKLKITEKDMLQKDWYIEAKKQTLETLPEFLRKLTEDYEHDYGTICNAVIASALGAMWAVDHTPEGGITGFQASCITWGVIRQWQFSSNKCGLRLLDYDNMLYPQYENRFEKTISEDTWKAIQKEAKKQLKENDKCHPDVKKHWESISAGNIPFGFKQEIK